ncbi:lysosomal proton-coupled steroid conjugate and bile acid symporter SLC46A3-like [Antedon mediterranea]|uniref:lysosomal proton-coupled steroid conjugate and bile acid symporter SLC46A3-like n=1 Tax=Antedon mediterranea TaxID=105859 RepID=UPI003AF552B6
MDTTEKEPPIVRRPGANRPRRVFIEPAMLLVMIGVVGLTAPITIQYVNHRVRQKYNLTSETSKSNCLNDSDDANDSSLQDQVQQEVTAWSLAYGACGAFPLLISTTIFATISDTIGRKIPLLLSNFGIIAQCLIVITVAYLSLPLTYLVIGNFICNCFGGYQLFFSVSLAIVADTAKKRQRTMKFIKLHTLIMCGSGLVQVGVGYLVDATGFIPPYCLAAGLFMIVVPYIIFIIPETVTTKQSICFGLTKFFYSVKILFTSNKSRRRIKIILLFLCHFLVFTTVIYFMPVVYLKVLSKPFCWNSVLIGYYSASQPIFAGIGLLCGGYILKQCLGDYGMIIVGLFSGILLMIGVGIATTTEELFIVAGIGALRNIPFAVLMALLSKTVDDKEQGTLFAFVGALEGLGLFLGPITLGSLYKMTVETYPATVFITMTGILLINMCLVWRIEIFRITSWIILYTTRFV